MGAGRNVERNRKTGREVEGGRAGDGQRPPTDANAGVTSDADADLQRAARNQCDQGRVIAQTLGLSVGLVLRLPNTDLVRGVPKRMGACRECLAGRDAHRPRRGIQQWESSRVAHDRCWQRVGRRPCTTPVIRRWGAQGAANSCTTVAGGAERWMSSGDPDRKSRNSRRRSKAGAERNETMLNAHSALKRARHHTI